MDPRMIGSRTRAPSERPREYNDPSKQDQPNVFYHQTRTQKFLNALGIAVLLGVVIAVLGSFQQFGGAGVLRAYAGRA